MAQYHSWTAGTGEFYRPDRAFDLSVGDTTTYADGVSFGGSLPTGDNTFPSSVILTQSWYCSANVTNLPLAGTRLKIIRTYSIPPPPYYGTGEMGGRLRITVYSGLNMVGAFDMLEGDLSPGYPEVTKVNHDIEECTLTIPNSSFNLNTLRVEVTCISSQVDRGTIESEWAFGQTTCQILDMWIETTATTYEPILYGDPSTQGGIITEHKVYSRDLFNVADGSYNIGNALGQPVRYFKPFQYYKGSQLGAPAQYWPTEMTGNTRTVSNNITSGGDGTSATINYGVPFNATTQGLTDLRTNTTNTIEVTATGSSAQFNTTQIIEDAYRGDKWKYETRYFKFGSSIPANTNVSVTLGISAHGSIDVGEYLVSYEDPNNPLYILSRTEFLMANGGATIEYTLDGSIWHLLDGVTLAWDGGYVNGEVGKTPGTAITSPDPQVDTLTPIINITNSSTFAIRISASAEYVARNYWVNSTNNPITTYEAALTSAGSSFSILGLYLTPVT